MGDDERTMFLRNYSLSDLKKDIPAGIIVALVSIPIAMGYAQVAGLPPVYGLYGSVLPILLFGLVSSSPRFVFGVDAAPAALCGALLYKMGITSGSDQALKIVPVITLMVAGWLLIFRLFHAGKLVKFISSPVMGGFISGICAEIILMQFPKLYGGDPGRGELFELVKHIMEELKDANLVSLVLGAGTILVILLCRKIIPKVPMSVVMMGIGALLTVFLHVDRYGVKLLPHVQPGMPGLVLPEISAASGNMRLMLVTTFSIAIVIVSETLLATSNYAMRREDTIDNDREISAYALATLGSAVLGCCPVNGSVSRTGIADQFGVKSQMMSVVAAISMVFVLLFATGFIAYLPVPVLTGIVVSALISSTEFDLAHKLRKVDKVEAGIFWASFFAVLLLGTVEGVIAGVLLSFLNVVLRASAPPREFLGAIPGQRGFYPCERMRGARPIKGALLYHFRAPLFFANAERMEKEIEAAIKPDTMAVVLVADGIGSIDVTAAEHLLAMYRKMKKNDIRFFMTEHAGSVNDQLRAFGCGEMFKDGAIRQSTEMALRAAGFNWPYELEDDENQSTVMLHTPARVLAEYEWAYGEDADREMTRFVEKMADSLAKGQRFDTDWMQRQERLFFGSSLSSLDEEKLLDLFEMQLALIAKKGLISPERMLQIEETITRHHAQLDHRISEITPDAIQKLVEYRTEREREFKRKYPQAYQRFMEERRAHRDFLMKTHPEVVEKIETIRDRCSFPRVIDEEMEHHGNEDLR